MNIPPRGYFLPGFPPVARRCLALAAVLLLPHGTASAASLLLWNLDCGTSVPSSAKSGAAAFGIGSNDFWNAYPTTWPTAYGALENLRLSDGTDSTVGLTVSNADSAWGIAGAVDPMMAGYTYRNPGNSPAGGAMLFTLTNLPAGLYDFYVYAHGGDLGEYSVCEVISAGVSSGTKATAEGAVWTLPNWVEGQQYVLFSNVAVVASQPVVLSVGPSPNDNAALNGFQVLLKQAFTTPAGLTAYWPADNHAQDTVGGIEGTPQNQAAYATGKFGQAFALDGDHDGLTLGNPAALQLQDFTIDAWIQRGSADQTSLDTGGGVIFGHETGGWQLGILDDGRIFLGMTGSSPITGGQPVTNLDWHHIAVTRTGTEVTFYVDATAGSTQSFGASFEFTTGSAIGALAADLRSSFLGRIDELAVYDRALSAADVAALAANQFPGKAMLASGPVILSAPQDAVGAIGTTVELHIDAFSTLPLSYQWRFQDQDIPGATGPTLTLANVQLENAGRYAVTVRDTAERTASAEAVLTVGLVVTVTLEGGGAVERTPDTPVYLAGTSVTLTARPNAGSYFLGWTGDAAGLNETVTLSVDRHYQLTARFASDIFGTVSAPSVVVSTVAGSGEPGFADGDGQGAQFYNPEGICTDAQGNLYVADSGNHRIRRIAPSGEVITLAGAGTGGYLDGAAANALLHEPNGVAVDAAGDLVIGDAQNNMLRRLGGLGSFTVTTVSGSITPGYRNGTADAARFNLPADVLVRTNGDFLVADANNHTIRLVNADGYATNWAGNGTAGYANGPRTSARFIRPTGLALDRLGVVHIAERGAHRIRRVLSNGSVLTTAGSTSPSGQAGFVDGGSTAARFNEPDGLVVSAAGTLYVADRGNHAIRSVTASGFVTTLVGNGQPGYADGATNQARLCQPAGVCLNAQGTLFVADSGNHCIRKVETIRHTLTLGLMTSRGLGLTVTGATNATYRVEASADLDTWTLVELVVAAGGRAQVLDSAATNNAHRFYRAVPSP